MRHRLTAMQIKKAPDGKLEDGGGLRLVKAGASGRWVYRYSHLGRRREMGLGSWPALSLAQARDLRDQWATELAKGIDPIDARKAAQSAEKAAHAQDDPTIADLTARVFEARKATLRGGGARGRWLSPLELHVLPRIGRLLASKAAPEDVVGCMRPIWQDKHPTAKKALQRLRIVFRDGQLMGVPCDPLVIDRARYQLGAVSYAPQPMSSTPWQDMPALYADLDPARSSHACLRWIMLTVVRIDAARRARASEIVGDVWTVPADRIKGLEGKVKDFRVPLSAPALALAREQAQFGDVLFPGQRGHPITDAGVEKALRETGYPGTPHGFRASFRTWAQDHGVAWDVSETILGHTIGGRVERSYARSDLLQRRIPVMEQWAAFLVG